MTSLDKALAQALAEPGTALQRGEVLDEGGDLLLAIGGVPVGTPRWALGGYYPAVGDSVLCARIGETWYVLCATTSAPPVEPAPPAPVPARGTVESVPVGSSTINVNVPGHGVLAVPFLDSYTPAVGNTVVLDWPEADEVPTVLGRPGSIPAPKPPPPQPPPQPPRPRPTNPRPQPVQRGRTRFNATNSGSYMGSAWNSYFGRHLMQGSVSGPSNRGAWFYGSRPTSTLRGRTVESARLRLGARRRVGQYNNSITIQIRRHTSRTRGSSFPAVEGTTLNVTLRPNAGARWITIPNNWAQEIIDNGGGIAIVGSTYGGIVGAGSGSGFDPSSGLLEINWRR